MALTIRGAALPDRTAVNTLLRQSGLMELDAASQFDADGQYVVSLNEAGEIIGVAGLERYGPDALLRSVAVAPGARSQGIGAALTGNRLAWCREQGIRAVYLLTTASDAFFSRHGFARITRHEGPDEVARSYQWSSACPASSIAMKLALR